VINWTYAEVYISGYRKHEFGWLTSIDTVNGTKHPTGIIEFGVLPEHKREFNKVKKGLAYKEDKNYVYMEPFNKATS
jgi:DNA ligase-1